MLYVGFAPHAVDVGFWYYLGTFAALAMTVACAIGGMSSSGTRKPLWIGGTLACLIATLGLGTRAIVLSNAVSAEAGESIAVNGNDYWVGVCATTTTNESRLRLRWQTDDEVSAGAYQVLSLRQSAPGGEHCGWIWPIRRNTITTVTVWAPAGAEWKITAFRFYYTPLEIEFQKRRTPLVSRFVDPSANGHYRFRLIAIDLREDIPTADISSGENTQSPRIPPPLDNPSAFTPP